MLEAAFDHRVGKKISADRCVSASDEEGMPRCPGCESWKSLARLLVVTTADEPARLDARSLRAAVLRRVRRTEEWAVQLSVENDTTVFAGRELERFGGLAADDAD